jgi:predicted ATPase
MVPEQPEQSEPMFQSIRLRNFKSYADSGPVPLKPLTVLVGRNNVGKSSLIQALLLLKQTMEGRSNDALVTTQPLVDLGGFYDILHGKGEIPERSEVGVSLALTPRPKRKKAESRSVLDVSPAEKLDVSFALSSESNEIQVTRCSIATHNEEDGVFEVWDGGKRWAYKDQNETTHKAKVKFRHFVPSLPPFPVSGESAEDLESVLREFGFAYWQGDMWMGVFERLHSVGPLRDRVPWYSGVGARTPSDLGMGGENLVGALGSREKIKPADRSLLELVNEWVAKIDVLERVEVHDVDQARTVKSLLADERSGTKGVNVAAMGTGISQVLPIIARSLASGRNECLVVEQPEIHLHPSLQANLADLFIDIVSENRRQVILETHSEHLLLRIRRRVAEGRIKPEQVAILYVEKEGAESTVRELNLNDRGHFNDWPKGFFEDAYQEAMALAEAAAEKGWDRSRLIEELAAAYLKKREKEKADGAK